jgi:hypothetical protein
LGVADERRIVDERPACGMIVAGDGRLVSLVMLSSQRCIWHSS